MQRKIAIEDGETFPGSGQPGRGEGHSSESYKDIWSESDSRSDNPPPVFTHKDPRTLKPHQKNSAIYGSEEDVTELIELIRSSGWVKPLVVTPTDTIISGHRRCKAVLALGWEEVRVEVRQFPDELAELEALLLENASRLKTTEQKVREGEAWKEVETFKAKLRQKACLKNGNRTPVPENFPEREKGESRDRIANRVGIGSGRTYEKAAKVVTVIDLDTLKGDLVTAQGLRKVLNEKSVDAAHTLAKKTPQERQAISELLVNGKAKSIKEAVKMLKKNNHAENHPPSQATLEGFNAGDWVLVDDNAQNTAHIGHKGQVEQIFPVEQQISVRFGDSPDKERFHPSELTLIVKAPPPNPFRVGEIAFIDIDACEAALDQEKRWNGYWAKVTHIGEVGSLSVDVGSISLQLFPRDLKQIDAQGTEFRSVVERVLRLRRLELDEVEERMLDVFQRREWLTPRQLYHLDSIEKFYILAESHRAENYQVV